MAFELHRYQQQQAFKAASTIAPHTVVGFDTVQNQVKTVASSNVQPFGIVGASAGPGGAVTVYEETNVVRAIAAASIGYGAEVTVASVGVSSQAQGGSTLATTTLLGVATGASGAANWAVGTAEEPAAAGEVFAVKLKFRQLGGAA